MAIKDFYEAIGDKKAPRDVYEVATKLVYRDFITVGLLVPRLKIKNKTKIKTLGDIVPDCWIYIQEREVKVGRLQIFNNWSPYMVKDPTNTVWIGMEYFVNEGGELWTLNDDVFIKMAIEELSKIGVIDANDVLDSVRVNVLKAYPAYFGSYERFDIVRKHLSSIDNLYCLGRNGQHRYNNMDHSMMTAMVAVDSIIDPSTTPKEDIWNVNTEKQYHETKTNPK
jgi:protoporphyrinogen oxidase